MLRFTSPFLHTGATHIVHHYVPGQPFYIRELVYRRVKGLMVEKGVRLNDFGIVGRANRYYDAKASDKTEAGAVHGTSEERRQINANNSHIEQMLLWVMLCSTCGVASYVLLDQWTTVALCRRIISKYLSKPKVVLKVD